MIDTLRTAAQAAEDFLDRRWRKTGACDDDLKEHAEALRAALAQPEQQAELEKLRTDNANLRSVMIAAAEEIHQHWEAHCDSEGYGPANLMHRLEQGIASEYAYKAGDFARLKAENDALKAAQPEQQPVAWMVTGREHKSLHMNKVVPPDGFTAVPLYRAAQPEQAGPAGLTPSRSAFEAAVRKSWSAGYACERFDDGAYKDATLRMAWYLVEETFKAAHPPAQPEQQSAYTDVVSDGGMDPRNKPEQQAADWTEPTSYFQRMSDAVTLLCAGKRPPEKMVFSWLDSTSEELQEFCIEHGPAWAQGIVLIDAARVMADTPTEGVDHEAHPPAQPGQKAGPFTTRELVMMNEAWLHRRAMGIPEPAQPEPVQDVSRIWRNALRELAFMARTSGGTAGADVGLMAALMKAEALLKLPYAPTRAAGAAGRKVRDFPAVKAAKQEAVRQLGYYREMMAQPEPAAYRYWKDKFGCWEYSDTPLAFPDVPAGTVMEPLYLHPAQPEQKAEPALYWPTQMPDEVAKWITENPPKITAGPPTLTLDQAQKIARDCIGLNLGDKLPDSLLRLTTYYCCEKAVGTGSTVCSDCSQHPYPKENPL